MFQKKLSKDQAIQKLRHYCGYQERCHSDVITKLRSLKVSRNDSNEILADLVTEGYVNEERFAISFAGGKFRVNSWGKEKIKYELKKRKLSPYCIQQAMGSIDRESYNTQAFHLALNKWKELHQDKSLSSRIKLKNFMVQKGFENALVVEMINKLFKETGREEL